jgi:DNA-binding Xre family transcriptional regulator
MASMNARVAAEIRAVMGRESVSQSDLAERLGVSQQWVSRRIGASAVSPLTLAEVERICTALDLDPLGVMRIVSATESVPA